MVLMNNYAKGKEVISATVSSLAGGYGVFLRYANGETKTDQAYLSKREAKKICENFNSLRRDGVRVFRSVDGGTPGYWVKGHKNLNFVLSFGSMIDRR